MKSTLLCAALLAVPAAFAAISGCATSEAVDPVSLGTTTTDTTSTTTGDPPPEGSVPKRTVSLRNPLGGPVNNLLLDGDFEVSAGYGTGQYGWRMFASNGSSELAMTVETGGLCHTGLSCVKIQKGQLLLGRGAAAPGEKGHVVSAHVKMPEGVPCTRVSVLAVGCDTFQVIKKAAPAPELEDGWCHHSAVFSDQKTAVCMYIQSSLDPDVTAIIDSAIIGPNDGTVVFSSTPDEPLDQATLDEMQRVRDFVRRTTLFGRPTPVELPRK